MDHDGTLEHSEVTFRYIGRPTDTGEVPGICFQFQSEVKAKELFRRIHRHLTTAGPKAPIRIEIERPNGAGSLRFLVQQDDGTFLLRVGGVEPDLLTLVERNFRAAGFYFVVAGYLQESEFILLDPKEYHLFKRDLYIDGEFVVGSGAGYVPDSSFFEG